MPTRPAVLLQSRKSAAAGSGTVVKATARSTQPTAAPPPVSRNGKRYLAKPATFRRAFIVPSRQRGDLTRLSSALDEEGPKIVDIRGGWPRTQEIAKFREEFGRIVVGKKGG